ncbi:hypothetical protein [Janibacter sp. LM]|uniref:hypothetical protein n=1 Tax=Janibacter TaxID=53457 RepID=UPI0031F67707
MSPTAAPDDEPLRRLERYLAADTIRVEEARERLIDIGDLLVTLRARMHNIDLGDDPGVQVLTQDVAAPIIDRIASQVARVDNVVTDIEVGAGREETNARHERDRAVAGQLQRTLVHPIVLESEISSAELAAGRTAGQLQRVSDLVESEFLVLGEEAVITLATWADPTSNYVLIRHPALVHYFRAWFELLWSHAPVIEAADADADEALLHMLMLGAKDEMIARTLHVGLRTVRRRVAALMDRYGVATRFQLGAALERDGRLSWPAR